MRRLLWVITLLTSLSIPAGAVLADPTNTPTPTPSTTPNNATRVMLETIAPPKTCGDAWSSCIPMPWSVPVFPTLALPSPTIWPTFTAIPITATATPSITVTASPTGPTATVTPPVDLGPVQTTVKQLQDQVATLEAASTADVLDASGTPVVLNDLMLGLSTNVPGMFSAVRGLQAATNNRTFGLVSFAITIILFLIVVNLLVMFMPVILRLVQFILQLIQALKPF